MAQVVVVDRIAYVSGQVAFRGAEMPVTGIVAREVSIEAAAEEAGRCMANALHRLQRALGSLDHVERAVRVTVYVASPSDFIAHPAVADGASRVLADVLGERGRHVRAAIGVASLPLGVPVEVELSVQLVPGSAIEDGAR